MDWQCGAGACVTSSDPPLPLAAVHRCTGARNSYECRGWCRRKGREEKRTRDRAGAVIDLVTWGKDVSKSKRENATSGARVERTLDCLATRS